MSIPETSVRGRATERDAGSHGVASVRAIAQSFVTASSAVSSPAGTRPR